MTRVYQELDVAVRAAADRFCAEARKLTELRRTAAAKLARAGEREMNELAMRSRFAIEVTPSEAPEAWSAQGWDAVECRIATNPGEPLKPLTEIASGGEMSRVMLALKAAVEAQAAAGARKRGMVLPRTLVFDEIDIASAAVRPKRSAAN